MNRRSLAAVASLALLAGAIAPLQASAQSNVMLTPGDLDFVLKAAAGGLEEVTLGEIGRQKGETNDVKAFAEQMVLDHGKANQKLADLAAQKGVNPPDQPATASQVLADVMKSMSGPAFDMGYIGQQVGAHQVTLALMTHASEHAMDADLKAFAAETIPVVQEHLQHAQMLMQKVQQGQMPAADQQPSSG